MIPIDIHYDIKKCGNFLSFFGIADTHFLCDDTDDNAYQPLDYNAYQYLKKCFAEAKQDKQTFGDIFTFTGGDLTELERSSVRKVLRSVHKNDSKAQDAIHKRILNDDVLPKLKVLTRDTRFIGGVAGNHLVEFSPDSHGTGYINSEDYLIKRLGGKYCGEGKLLINLHLKLGGHRCLKKIIITHGQKAGTKASIINELQKMYYQYGKIDLLIKAHAHEAMAGFNCRYDLPDTSTGKMKKQETVIMCLGSTRGGEVMGYDDYCERANFAPIASRYPVAIFHAYKPMENNRSLEVKIRPYIM